MTGIEDSARRMLEQYAWPGNVRELANSIERAVVLTENRKLRREDFPLALMLGGESSRLALPTDVMPLKEMERQMIVRALEKTGGNRTQAAEILGIAVRTLRNKINEYGLRSRPEPEELVEEVVD